MAITKISGALWANITKVGGIIKASITGINNVATPPLITCTPAAFGYSDGRRDPPEAACTNFPIIWDYDVTNGALYIPGQCGITHAPAGYYAGGGTLYFYDGANSFFPVGSCSR